MCLFGSCNCLMRRAFDSRVSSCLIRPTAATLHTCPVQNRTTIEMYEKMYVTPWPYDKGWRRNFQEVRST